MLDAGSRGAQAACLLPENIRGAEMEIALGADHGGFDLKEQVKDWLREMGHDVTDAGCYSSESVDYPEYAEKVCDMVRNGVVERGILICGTGIGMSMAANRHAGIRAALCHEIFTAAMSRHHNDANVLCMGGRVIGSALALEMVKTWTETPFDDGRHSRRIAMFDQT